MREANRNAKWIFKEVNHPKSFNGFTATLNFHQKYILSPTTVRQDDVVALVAYAVTSMRSRHPLLHDKTYIQPI